MKQMGIQNIGRVKEAGRTRDGTVSGLYGQTLILWMDVRM